MQQPGHTNSCAKVAEWAQDSVADISWLFSVRKETEQLRHKEKCRVAFHWIWQCQKNHVIHWLGQCQCPSTVYTGSNRRCLTVAVFPHHRCLPSSSLPPPILSASFHPYCPDWPRVPGDGVSLRALPFNHRCLPLSPSPTPRSRRLPVAESSNGEYVGIRSPLPSPWPPPSTMAVSFPARRAGLHPCRHRLCQRHLGGGGDRRVRGGLPRPRRRRTLLPLPTAAAAPHRRRPPYHRWSPSAAATFPHRRYAPQSPLLPLIHCCFPAGEPTCHTACGNAYETGERAVAASFDAPAAAAAAASPPTSQSRATRSNPARRSDTAANAVAATAW